MKHILFLVTSFDGGGAEKALIELLKAFDYSRFRVSVCMLYYRGDYLRDIPKQVNTIVLYPTQNSFYRKSFRFYRKYQNTWLFSFRLWQKLEGNYDVIVSFLEGAPLLFHSLVVDRAAKNIAWLHCDLFNFHYTLPCAFRNEEAEKKAYAKMDHLVFVSKNSMNNFRNMYKLNNAHSCLYNVIDAKRIRDAAALKSLKQEEPMIITTIGRLTPVKGYDRLIRVAAKLKAAGYDFLIRIIGQGEELDNLMKQAQQLGVQENVLFEGFLENPYPYLKHSDVYLSTSLSEGLPFVICEALILGVPIVATKTAGALELLENGAYGVLTEHDDDAIFNGLRLLLDDKQIREEYTNKGLQRAAQFDVKQTMDAVYKLFL